MPQFDRNYEALGRTFPEVLRSFLRQDTLRQQSAEALLTLFEDMESEDIGLFLEFAASHFQSRSAQAALAVSMEDRKMAWVLQGLLGYVFGKATRLQTGWSVSFTPASSSYSLEHRGEHLAARDGRYHILFQGWHIGVAQTRDKHTVCAVLYGSDERAKAQCALWVKEGRIGDYWRLDYFFEPALPVA